MLLGSYLWIVLLIILPKHMYVFLMLHNALMEQQLKEASISDWGGSPTDFNPMYLFFKVLLGITTGCGQHRSEPAHCSKLLEFIPWRHLATCHWEGKFK